MECLSLNALKAIPVRSRSGLRNLSITHALPGIILGGGGGGCPVCGTMLSSISVLCPLESSNIPSRHPSWQQEYLRTGPSVRWVEDTALSWNHPSRRPDRQRGLDTSSLPHQLCSLCFVYSYLEATELAIPQQDGQEESGCEELSNR